MKRFEIEFVNAYGHIVKSFIHECETEKQAIRKAKKEKSCLYPECHIEIICFDSLKRIYA